MVSVLFLFIFRMFPACLYMFVVFYPYCFNICIIIWLLYLCMFPYIGLICLCMLQVLVIVPYVFRILSVFFVLFRICSVCVSYVCTYLLRICVRICSVYFPCIVRTCSVFLFVCVFVFYMFSIFVFCMCSVCFSHFQWFGVSPCVEGRYALRSKNMRCISISF
jgi:hypothetical protein